MIVAWSISWSAPALVLVVPDDEGNAVLFSLPLFNFDYMFLRDRVITCVDYEYEVSLFIGLQDLDLDTESGVVTQVSTLLYSSPLHRSSRKSGYSMYNILT